MRTIILGFTISMCHLAVKIRGTFQAHWNKITHLCIMIKNEMIIDLFRIWMRQLFASVGQVAEPSHRYILTNFWYVICGLSYLLKKHKPINIFLPRNGPQSVGYLY